MAVLELESRYRAIAVEMDVFFEERRKAVVWLYPEKSAVDVFWDLRSLRLCSVFWMVDLLCRWSQARRYRLVVAMAC